MFHEEGGPVSLDGRELRLARGPVVVLSHTTRVSSRYEMSYPRNVSEDSYRLQVKFLRELEPLSLIQRTGHHRRILVNGVRKHTRDGVREGEGGATVRWSGV